jgi:hypothetical protein
MTPRPFTEITIDIAPDAHGNACVTIQVGNRRFHWRKKAAVAKGYRRHSAWLTHHAERINNLLDERHPTYVPSALAGAMS